MQTCSAPLLVRRIAIMIFVTSVITYRHPLGTSVPMQISLSMTDCHPSRLSHGALKGSCSFPGLLCCAMYKTKRA